MQTSEHSRETLLVVLLLSAAVMVCYGGVLNAGFIWDDEFLVVQNPLIRAPLWSLEMFRQDVLNTGFRYSIYYRPLQILSYAVDYRLRGLEPFVFHLTNLFMHFLNGVLLFFLTRKITGKPAAALIASLLFVIHPAHAAVVAYISGRADLMFFFFGFLYMLFHLAFRENGERPLLALSICSLAAALMCKEAAVIFPFLLVAADRGRGVGKFRDGLLWALPGFLTAGVYAAGHYILLGRGHAGSPGTAAVPDMLAGYARAAAGFLTLSVIPAGLHMRRSLAGTSGWIPAVITAWAVTAFSLMKAERRKLSFAAVFFLLAVIPFSFVLKSAGTLAEHWMYLPGCGIFIFIALVLDRGYSGRAAGRILVSGAVLLMTFAYAVTTAVQSRYWSDDRALSGRILAFSGEDEAALFYNAVADMKEDDAAAAARNMNIFVNSRTSDPAAWYLKGRLALAVGKTEEAVKDFEQALAVDPGHLDGYVGLAMAAAAKGDNASAIKYLERVILDDPLHFEALIALTRAYAEEGMKEDAVRTAVRARDVNPYDYRALVTLGTAYTRAGSLREGAEVYLRATQLYPERPVAFYNLGEVFYASCVSRGGNKSDAAEARRWLIKAIRVDPSFKPAHDLLRKLRTEHMS